MSPTRKSANLERILLFSSSVIYGRIIRGALSELEPRAVLTQETGASLGGAAPVLGGATPALGGAMPALGGATPPDLIIIDTTASADLGGLLCGLDAACPGVPKVLLCERREYQCFCVGIYDGLGDYAGADRLHFIEKPINENYNDNLRIIKNEIKLALFNSRKAHAAPPAFPVRPARHGAAGERYSLLLIATSTGGPAAIERIFSGLPARLNLPVLIVQHMSAVFTKGLADGLREQFSIDVSEAASGDEITPGRILLAPGGLHMFVDRERRIALRGGETVNGVKPSADVLFVSVAEHFRGERILAVILTGMGSDGTEGVRALKGSCRCFCVAQDEASCTVYGMPRAIVEAGLHDRIAPLDSIAGLISRLLRVEEDVD